MYSGAGIAKFHTRKRRRPVTRSRGTQKSDGLRFMCVPHGRRLYDVYVRYINTVNGLKRQQIDSDPVRRHMYDGIRSNDAAVTEARIKSITGP